MSNYYETLRKIMSDSKLKKPKPKIRDRGKVDLEDLIREAEELDAKGKLSESDFDRIQEIRNEVSNRLLGDNVSIDDIIEDSVNLLRKPTRSKKATDYRDVLPKHMQKMNPISVIHQAEDQKFNRKIRDRQSLAREAVRNDYNRLPSETRWDPIAQEETDLLAEYAKEDSLERARDKLRTQKAVINNYGDIAFQEGYHDPESRRILFNAMDELGPDYEDAIKMIKGDISGLTENPRFANDPMIREAFENYLYEKGFPIDKIDQLNKATKGSIVSREALTDREKMLRLLEDIEAQTGIDKMFAAKLRDDTSAVGGVIDETPVELTGMSQLGRRKMNDDLKNKLVAYRTKKGATTGTDIDDVLLNPYLSNNDISNSKRYNLWKNKKEATLEREQNVDPKKKIYHLKDVHPEKGEKLPERLRASDIRDRSEIIEDAINKRYGSVDNLRKINSDVPEGAEHIAEEANSWLNAYDDAIDAERKFADFEDNRQAESIADQFLDPAVLERRDPTPRSGNYGGGTMRIRREAAKTREKKRDFIKKRQEHLGLNLPEEDIDEILWLAKNSNDVDNLLVGFARKRFTKQK